MEDEFLIHIPIVSYVTIKVKANNSLIAEIKAKKECEKIKLIDSNNGVLIGKHTAYVNVDGWRDNCTERDNFLILSKKIE